MVQRKQFPKGEDRRDCDCALSIVSQRLRAWPFGRHICIGARRGSLLCLSAKPIRLTLHAMRLAEFLGTNGDQIIHQWEEFAKKISGAGLPQWLLRDHAATIIKSIAERMESPTLPFEQRLIAVAVEGAPVPIENITGVHVKLRIESGFDLAQIVAEYCALRACTVRLWRELRSE